MRAADAFALQLLNALDGRLARLVRRQVVVPLDQQHVDDGPDAHLGQVREDVVLGALNVHLDDDEIMRQRVHEQPARNVDGRQLRALFAGRDGVGVVLVRRRAPVVVVRVDLVEVEGADAVLGVDDGGRVDGDALAEGAVLLLGADEGVVEDGVGLEEEDF